MATFFMFNAISLQGLDTQRTLLRTDIVEALEYNVFDPKFALTRLLLKGDFASTLHWSFYACSRNLPSRKIIEAALKQPTPQPRSVPSVVGTFADTNQARLYFYEGGYGVTMTNVPGKTPRQYALDLAAGGRQIICFPRPSDYKARYGVA